MYSHDIITIQQLRDENIITFHIKKINILNAKEIEYLLLGVMNITKNDLILDLSNVQFIDSSGFAMLHRLKIQAYVNKTQIIYINISAELQDLFNFINYN